MCYTVVCQQLFVGCVIKLCVNSWVWYVMYHTGVHVSEVMYAMCCIIQLCVCLRSCVSEGMSHKVVCLQICVGYDVSYIYHSVSAGVHVS